jgi:hypothetical protein
MAQQIAFATGVPPNIYAFHRYTRNSICLYHTQVYQFLKRNGVEPQDLILDLINRLRTLYAQ